jgi:hypothetical protein
MKEVMHNVPRYYRRYVLEFRNIQSLVGKPITFTYLNYQIPVLPHSDVLPVLRH